MSSKRADRVWLRLSQWYGARWAETYGPKPTEDWVKAVDAASDQQIAGALTAIRSRHLTHPPTLPEFEAAIRAIPKPGAAASGPSIVDRLDAAMMRVTTSPTRIVWMYDRDESGKLTIVGVQFWTKDHQGPVTITAASLERAAA